MYLFYPQYCFLWFVFYIKHQYNIERVGPNFRFLWEIFPFVDKWCGKKKKLIENAQKTNYLYSFLFQTIPESAFCTIAPTPTFLFESSFLLFFLIPMTIMIFLYIRMGLKISTKQPFDKNSAVHNESRQAQSKKAILKMLGKYIYLFQNQCSQVFSNALVIFDNSYVLTHSVEI